jgi:hypothetical protein
VSSRSSQAQERRSSEGRIKVSDRKNPRKAEPGESAGQQPAPPARVKTQEPRLVSPYTAFWAEVSDTRETAGGSMAAETPRYLAARSSSEGQNPMDAVSMKQGSLGFEGSKPSRG